MEKGTRVNTPDGPGTIVDIEESYLYSSGRRYCVELDVSRYSYPVACYWTHEIESRADG